MYRNILIPVDDSAQGEHAARTALQLARLVGAKPTLLHVAYQQPISGLESQELQEKPYLNYARTMMQSLTRRLEKLGVPFETRVVRAEHGVAETITRTAQDGGFDLIVMGTHGREGFNRVLLGSVAERVARLSNIPVMLEREPTGKE